MDNKKEKRNEYIELLGEPDNNVRLIFSGHEHHQATRRIDEEFVNLPINFPREALIQAGNSWRYFKGMTAPPGNWNERTFDDSSWDSGATGIGYGDDDLATELNDMEDSYVSVYTRKSFTISSLSEVQQVDLRLTYDDGCVIYVNGTEVTRVNMPGGTISETTTASTKVEPSKTIWLPLSLGAFREGNNVLAVSVHNRSTGSSDLTFIPILSLRRNADLVLDGEFREVKTGSCGAPWKEKSFVDYMEGLAAEVIEIPEDWTGEGNDYPYHYAVVDVYKREATFDVYAIPSLPSGSGQGAQIVEDVDRVRVGGSTSYSELVDADADGGTDGVAITAPTGAGEVHVELPEERPTGLALSRPDSTTDTALDLDQATKPDRRFPYGLVGEEVLGILEGQTVTLTLEFPGGIPEDSDYYGIGAGWEALAYDRVDGDTITVAVTDGGPGDRDGDANGAIVHLGALAAPVDRILPGDCNADGFLDVSDAICTLDYLFEGVGVLPCGTGTLRTVGNRVLLDFNGPSREAYPANDENEVDLSDVVAMLNFLFLGGRPHAVGRQCVAIRGCPATCRD